MSKRILSSKFSSRSTVQKCSLLTLVNWPGLVAIVVMALLLGSSAFGQKRRNEVGRPQTDHISGAVRDGNGQEVARAGAPDIPGLSAGNAGNARIVPAAYHGFLLTEPFDPPSQASQAKIPATDEKVHGPGQPSAEAILQLAERYQGEGKYGEAEALLKRALAMREKSLGPDHPSVKAILFNLAMVDQLQGKYGEAEVLLERVLAMREKGLELNEDSFWTIAALVMVYRLQGKYGEAVALAKRALAIDEKALEPDNPMAALFLCNRAVLYQQQGKYGEAQALVKQALAIDEKVAGPDHPMVARDLYDLARLYQQQGKYGEAEPLYKRALAIDEKALGPDHLTVAMIAENLGSALRKLGRDSEAGVYEEQAVRIRAKIKRHSTTGGQNPE